MSAIVSLERIKPRRLSKSRFCWMRNDRRLARNLIGTVQSACGSRLHPIVSMHADWAKFHFPDHRFFSTLTSYFSPLSSFILSFGTFGLLGHILIKFIVFSQMASTTMSPGGGFSAFNAWQQRETYEFLLLQSIAVVLACIISMRDSGDRQKGI
jgi:hypothetical protein